MDTLSQQTMNKNGLHHQSHQMSHQHPYKQQQTISGELQASLERLSKTSSQDFRPAQKRQQQPQLRQHSPIKMGVDPNSQSTVVEGAQVQRKLCSFLCVYCTLIVASYTAYYFYHHQRQQQQSHPLDNRAISIESATAKLALASAADSRQQEDQQQQQQQFQSELETRLESKIHLLERYIEVIAVDLQETKSKLREREKCDCSISCTFNGTRYLDRSSWQNQCDICTCQAGRISCVPQKCPITNCDDAILLPGQCCPTCMKKCKHNDKLYRHGQKFKPNDSTMRTNSQQSKECRCYDGRIRCEQVQKASAAKLVVAANSNSSFTVGAIRAAIAATTATANNIATTQREPSLSGSVSSSQETKGRQGQMTADSAPVAMPATSNAGAANTAIAANIATVTASPLSASDRQQFETKSEAEQEHHLQQQQHQESILEASSGKKPVLGKKNESPLPIAANAEKAQAGNAPANVREAHENG